MSHTSAGAPEPVAGQPPAPPKTCGLAIASLVCGIAGYCTAGLAGIAGLILGIVGLRKINRSGGALAGRGLAIAGIVVSATSLVFLICLMIAILIPAVFGARDLAFTVQSANNVKQLCQAAMLYGMDQGGQLPPTDSWPQELEKYLGDKTTADKLLADPGDENGGRAYAMNAKLTEQYGRLSAIRQPARTVLFFECAPRSPPSGGLELLPPKPRHAGKYVIGFCDGHAEAMEPEQVNRLIWDPNVAPPGP